MPGSSAVDSGRDPGAAGDDGIERVGVASRTAIEDLEVTPVAGFGEIMGDQAKMAGIIEKVPAGDGSCRQTAVREGYDERRSRL